MAGRIWPRGRQSDTSKPACLLVHYYKILKGTISANRPRAFNNHKLRLRLAYMLVCLLKFLSSAFTFGIGLFCDFQMPKEGILINKEMCTEHIPT